MADTITVDPSQVDSASTITVDPSQVQAIKAPAPALPNPADVARIAEANAKMTVDAITRPAPLPPPIPARLDNTTPDPRSLVRRTADSYVDSAAGVLGGVSDIGKGSTYDYYPRQLNLPSSQQAVTAGAKHVSESLQPVMNTAVGAGLATAPLQTVVGLLEATAAQKGTSAALKAGGMDPDRAGLLGDVAGLGAGVIGGAGAKGSFDRFMEAKLDAANTRATEGVAKERMQGKESATDVLGGESIPIQIDGKAAEIRPGGQSTQGRPFYTVVDAATGKPIYGGYGDSVQEFLRSKGASPETPAGEPATVQSAQVERVESPESRKQEETSDVRKHESAQSGGQTEASSEEVSPEQVARVEARPTERSEPGERQGESVARPSQARPEPSSKQTLAPDLASTPAGTDKELALPQGQTAPPATAASRSPEADPNRLDTERHPGAESPSPEQKVTPLADGTAKPSTPQSPVPSAEEYSARVLNALRSDGHLTNSAALQRALPDIPREQLGQVLNDLQDSRQVILHQHSTPLAGLQDRQDELQSLIPHPDGKTGIVGVAARSPENIPASAPRDTAGASQPAPQSGGASLPQQQDVVQEKPQAQSTPDTSKLQTMVIPGGETGPHHYVLAFHPDANTNNVSPVRDHVGAVVPFAPPQGMSMNNMVGRAVVHENQDDDGNKLGTFTSAITEVDPRWQRQGIAKRLYAESEKHTGQALTPSTYLSTEGTRLWQSIRRGQGVQPNAKGVTPISDRERGFSPNSYVGDMFGTPKNSGERGAATIGAMTMGLDKFVEHDVAPTVRNVAQTIRDTGDDILKILAPAARGRDAKAAALIMRGRMSELARRTDQVQAALATAKKYFDSQSATDNYDFINKIESGQAQATPELQAIADTFRKMMDERRSEVQSLGTGKLQQFYTNYFPHIWEDPKKATNIMQAFFGKRPLEGGKAFLKKRTHVTFADGLAAGLKPVSDNPVEMIILKAREMDKYLMAHRVLKDWKAQGIAQEIDARKGKAPAGWMKIDDPIGTVYGQSVQKISEFQNEGLYEGLEATAAALGIRHHRTHNTGKRGVLGFASRKTGDVVTKHGTAEDVLAHEIGHVLEWKYGLSQQLMNYPDARTAMKIDKELVALADLRNAPVGYRRNKDEKMAAIAQAWVGAREAFKRTAPTVFKEWTKFLKAHPELAHLKDIEGSMNHKALGQPYDVGGLVIKGNHYAPEGAARILNNYLAPGLRAKSGLYRAVLGLNNVMNQAQLGLSAFHLGFTSADAAVSKAALGFEQLMRGKPVAAAKSFATTPAAPLTNWLQGNKVLKEWMTPGSQGGDLAALVNHLVSAGGRAHMDEFYQTHIADAMKQAWRHGNWFGAVLRAPFAAVEQISNLIMKEIVPRQKLGVFADLARFELEQLGPNAPAKDVQAALAKVWDSVENRMGQMTYDNLFWAKTAKDIAMISVRSVGWNLGTLRELGGGAVDAVKLPVQLAGGFGGKKAINPHRMAYWAGLVTVSAIMGAIYQYLATGKGPQETKDYFFPKNGELDESGRPQRMAMPTYLKDVYHYGTEPGKTLTGKVAPIWSTFGEMIHNKDFYGTEIRNADDPLVQQMLDEAKHVTKNFVPFGIRNMQREQKLGASPARSAQAEIGITAAPSSINKTKAELLASELANDARPVGTRTKEEAARREAANTISRLARSGKPFGDQAKEALQKGLITRQDLHSALLRSKQKPLAAQFSHASLPDALKVWAVATPDERRELRPLLAKKAHALNKEPQEVQRTLTPKVKAALSQ